MSEGARVQSIDALKEFRVRLAKCGEAAGLALGEADSDVTKTQTWLEGEAQTYWNGQIRKCQELCARAEEAYRHKRLYKDATGSTPSAVDELKALNIAKKNLAYAIEKLANCKSSVRKLQKEQHMYRGGVASFANQVSSGIPHAIGLMANIISNLEKYTDITLDSPAGAEMAGSSAGGPSAGGASMKRTTDGAPEQLIELDGKMLREMIPPVETLLTAKRGPIQLKPVAVPPDQHAAIQALGAPPAASGDDRFIVAPGTKESARVLVSRIAHEGAGAIWYIAPIDGTAATQWAIINAADLLEGHADLRILMSLPAGFIAVLDFTGVSVVYDDKNAEAWKPPQPVAAESEKQQ